MKQKKRNFICSYSDPIGFVFAFLSRFFLPLTIINIFYFQYQNYQDLKKNHFQGKIHSSDFDLHFTSNTENVSISNSSISIIFAFPEFQDINEINLFKICLKSWIDAFPKAEILTFFNQKGIYFYNNFLKDSSDDDEFKKIKYLPQIDTDELGIIYIDDLFHKIFINIKTDLICIVKNYAFLPTKIGKQIFFLSSFFSRRKQQFSAIGMRCSLQLQLNDIKFNSSNIESYLKVFLKDNLLKNVNIIENSMYSNDFIFLSLNNNKLDIDEIPNFHYGLDRYDTWIPGWMNEHIPVVSLGDECSSYNIGNYHNYDFLDKLAENFEVARFNGDKFAISSRLELKIKGNKLINGTEVIAVF